MPHANQRPMPADFAEFAKDKRRYVVEKHYQCGNTTIQRWYAEAGMETPTTHQFREMVITYDKVDTVRAKVASGMNAKQIAQDMGVARNSIIRFVRKHSLGPWKSHSGTEERPIPDDFRELAPSMPRETAAKRWKVGAVQLSRWYGLTGIRPGIRRSTLRQPPADLRARVDGMNIKDAAKEMGVSRDIMSRWMRQVEIAVPRPIKSEKVAYDRSAARRVPVGTWKPVPVEYVRDMSAVGQAASELAKLGPIHRCNTEGKPDKTGSLWRRGNTILTDEDVLERMPRDWKPVY